MLHEASVLSSHLQAYRGKVEGYAPQAAAFFDAVRDFLASSGGRATLSIATGCCSNLQAHAM
jgi:hypothetical protein